MKKTFLFLFVLISSWLYSQQEIKIIIPKQFKFQKQENQYRLNTLVKHRLTAENRQLFWADALPPQIVMAPCQAFRLEVKNSSTWLTTKVFVELIDCKGEVVFTSEEGKSSEKDFERSFTDAVTKALVSVNDFLNERTQNQWQSYGEERAAAIQILYAKNWVGKDEFSLFNQSGEIIFTLQKTSIENTYLAQRHDGINGLLTLKNNLYHFEYSQNSEKHFEYYQIDFQ